MPKTGRPTKITYELIKRITDIIRAGNYIETASAHAGIDKSTLHRWLKRGAREIERVENNKNAKIRKEEKIFVDFCNSIKKAVADSEIKDLLTISKASEVDWKASAWRLERRFPQKWGRREYIEGDFKNETTTTERREFSLEQKLMTDPESAELLKQLYRRQNNLEE